MFDTSWPATSSTGIDRLPASKELAEGTTRVARRSDRFRVGFGNSHDFSSISVVIARGVRPSLSTENSATASRSRISSGGSVRDSNRSRHRGSSSRRGDRLASSRLRRDQPDRGHLDTREGTLSQRSCHRRLSISRATTGVRIPRAAYCGHTAARFSKPSASWKRVSGCCRVGLAEPVSIRRVRDASAGQDPRRRPRRGSAFRPFDGRSPSKPWPAPPRWPIMVAVGEPR